MSNLADMVTIAAKDAGGIRALARASGLCPGYICRMARGEKLNPSDEALEAIGLTREVRYRFVRART